MSQATQPPGPPDAAFTYRDQPDLARCKQPGCPVRFTDGGPDRYCRGHLIETARWAW